jgi:hypothetical protein
MSNLDDLKDELEFELTMGVGARAAPQDLRNAIEVGFVQLDAGATYGEALAAAKLLLRKEAA